MDVRPNDDSTDDLRRLHPDDFLYFPYTVEVVVERDRDTASEYVSFVGLLMDRLYAEGMQVVAACDWESDLPGRIHPEGSGHHRWWQRGLLDHHSPALDLTPLSTPWCNAS